MVINFHGSLLIHKDQMIIGSKFDVDQNSNQCRIGFYGKFLHEYKTEDELKQLKLYRWKERKGKIDRVTNEKTVVIKDLFGKQTDTSKFLNLKVKINSFPEYNGKIVQSFGKSGKVKAIFEENLKSIMKELKD